MPNVEIPDDIREDYERIVQDVYGGDESKALAAAVRHLVKQDKSKLKAGVKFDMVFKQVRERREKADDILKDSLSKTLERQRQLRDMDFDLSRAKQDEEPPKENE